MNRTIPFIAIGIVALAIVAVVAIASSRNGDGGAVVRLPGGQQDDEGTGASGAAERVNPGTAAVVSAHELATQAGLDVLARGGSAADAAVAVAAVLTVVEPWFSSVLGGGTWGLYYEAGDGVVTSLDGVGPTGSNASIADHEPRAGDPGMHQAIVPGAWDGWMLWLDRYGRLDLGEVLAPAIAIAREGNPASSEMAFWLSRSAIHSRPDTARIYAPEGVILQQGEIVYQHDLADTFDDLIAAYDGSRAESRSTGFQAARDYFYRGPLAQAIVQFSDEQGGYLTLEDFSSFEAEIVDPISIAYDDQLTVYENPPNSQGITMLMALNILKGYDFEGMAAYDPEAVHRQIEAMKLAFADRHHHVGDPVRIDVPVEELLSDDYAERQRARIEDDDAMSWPLDSGVTVTHAANLDFADTSTFHVVDADGNAAAVTTSLGAQFLVVGDTGIHINNRMRFLSLEEGNANELTPGYKVRHTSNPYMVLRDGQLYILGGNTGVDAQSQVQVQQFMNIVEFGFSAQDAVSQPRWVTGSFPATTWPFEIPNVLSVESDYPPDLVAGLEERGHTVEVEGATFGGGAVLVLSADGLQVQVGADPRISTAAGEVVAPPP